MKAAAKLVSCAALTAAAAAGPIWAAYAVAFRRGKEAGDREIPDGPQYDPYRKESLEGIETLLSLPFERWELRSFDGLILRGRYYAGRPDRPLVIFFHGYRSGPIRDGSGGFRFCRGEGCSVLMVDQRAHGKSEGKTITFGALEKRDCLAWAREAARRNPGRGILLAGVSMGAATVLCSAALDLPDQVKGIWADCGYADTEEILRDTIRRWGAPVRPLLRLTKAGARIFGRFRVEDASPLNCVRSARVPVLLVHGEEDPIVPCEMAYRIAEACASPVSLLTVPGAGHGMSYYADTAAYVTALKDFFDQIFQTSGDSSGDDSPDAGEKTEGREIGHA